MSTLEAHQSGITSCGYVILQCNCMGRGLWVQLALSCSTGQRFRGIAPHQSGNVHVFYIVISRYWPGFGWLSPNISLVSRLVGTFYILV